MPYADPEVKRQKARERAARQKAERDALKASTNVSSSSGPDSASSGSSFSSGAGQTASESAPPRPSYRPKRKKGEREVSTEALRSLHETVSLGVGFLSVVLIPDPSKRMTEREQEAIFLPLERWYLRHASVPELSPDTQDVLASSTALFMYLVRIGALNVLLARRPREDREGFYRGYERRQREREARVPSNGWVYYDGPGPENGPEPAPSPAPAPDHGINGRGLDGQASRRAEGVDRETRGGSAAVSSPDALRTPEQILTELAEASYVPDAESAGDM